MHTGRQPKSRLKGRGEQRQDVSRNWLCLQPKGRTKLAGWRVLTPSPSTAPLQSSSVSCKIPAQPLLNAGRQGDLLGLVGDDVEQDDGDWRGALLLLSPADRARGWSHLHCHQHRAERQLCCRICRADRCQYVDADLSLNQEQELSQPSCHAIYTAPRLTFKLTLSCKEKQSNIIKADQRDLYLRLLWSW